MDRRTLTRELRALGRLLELDGASAFQTRAILEAASRLDDSPDDPVHTFLAGQLQQMPGIGKSLLADIGQLVRHGHHDTLEALRRRWPGQPLRLLDVPGLGPAKVRSLFRDLGIHDLAGLDDGLRRGTVTELKGFGQKTAAKLIPHVTYMRETEGMVLLPDADALAADAREALARLPGVVAVHVAGSVARRDDMHARLDLVVVHRDEQPPAAALAALGFAPTGESWTRPTPEGPDVRVHPARPESAGAKRVRCGANPAHLRALEAPMALAGLSWKNDLLVGQDGSPVPTPDEEAVYAALGLPWIPPELREGTDEIELARSGSLPQLVTMADIQGVFHTHTTASDGRADLAGMAAEARRLGFGYLAVTEHSHAAGYAGGLSSERLRAQHVAVADWNAAAGTPYLLSGLEADILADGTLDMGEALDGCDLVIASVHSRHGEDEGAMTRRIVRALEDPRTTVLGHMSGRLLGERAPYPMDHARIHETAARHGVHIEINGNPQRLDIDWRQIRAARATGVTFCLSPDAHSIPGIGHVRYALDMARKGGLKAADILNSKPLDALREFLADRNSRTAGT
ncbi:MAG: helix-hairpin-helix domain-containing protein [Candidatus Sericytochromatia bacterium]|nr:helix-hairpin-helix domain-containing protein [Candidatus Sericytochromatia bacterium]